MPAVVAACSTFSRNSGGTRTAITVVLGVPRVGLLTVMVGLAAHRECGENPGWMSCGRERERCRSFLPWSFSVYSFA
jgi:hypothetical protein